MHLGNLWAALLSWLSARSAGGRWVLRIEDLDRQRSRREYALRIQEDLRWLGLDWDEGGVDADGPHAPYCQSGRDALYESALEQLKRTGMVYPCRCTRADLLVAGAPHQSDGRVIYGGRCRPPQLPAPWPEDCGRAAARLYVPPGRIDFVDGVYGPQSVDLQGECGDFVLRRADGQWAYQLAVVVDDADMGVTQVVRGSDLLLSAAQQLYLYRLLHLPEPDYTHIPLLVNESGQRLSKRDSSLAMDVLRERFTPAGLTGRLGYMAGLIPEPAPCTPSELLGRYDVAKIPASRTLCVGDPDQWIRN